MATETARRPALIRWLYLAAGLACVGLGIVGIVLPVVPTTPFLLLASYCFVRSSPRLHRWLRNSPVFGRFLRDWEEQRGIRRPVQIVAVVVVLTVIGVSLWSPRLPPPLKVVLALLGTVGLVVVLRLKIVGGPPSPRAPAGPKMEDYAPPLSDRSGGATPLPAREEPSRR